MDIRLALMAGTDIPVPELKLILHQPILKEIALMGEQDFFTAVHFICLKKEAVVQDKSLLATLTNFQVLMKVLEQTENREHKIAIQTLLSILFPSHKTIITPNSIILNNVEAKESILFDDTNFTALQDVVTDVLCVNNIFQGENIIYKPANALAQKIADKIMAGRKKVAEIKGKNAESVLSRYISILTIGVQSMSLQDCLNLTLYQLFDLVERFTLFTEWDVDLRVRLAGGEPKGEAENWMKNIH